MFLFDWWYNILSFLAALGLYQKRARILFLGLDDAGKTALLYLLKEGRVTIHSQTTYKTYPVEFTLGMMTYKTFDMGGTLNARRLWRDYYGSGAVDGIVFVVDAEDRRRFPEAKDELDTLLSSDALAKVPFLVLGNKTDLKSAASEEELRYQLGLDNKTYGKEYAPLTVFRNMSPDRRPIEVFMCSVVQQSGYSEGFKWLSQFL